MKKKLFLYEQILLLALRDKEGTFATGTLPHYGIAAAILSELLIQERIEIRKLGKKSLVEAQDPSSTGNALLDECLNKITARKKRRQLQEWVTSFANIKDVHHRVARQLCRRGVLRTDEDKILFVFKRTIYPELDPRPEREVIEGLREVVLSDTTAVDPRIGILVSLGSACNLLKTVFSKHELRERKERIDLITSGELIGQAAKGAVEAAQTAALITTINPAITTTIIR